MDSFDMFNGTQQNARPQAPKLRSIGILEQLSTEPTSVSMTDVIGLIGGGAAGLYIATKFPNAVVKYVGVIIGAELGIFLARALKK